MRRLGKWILVVVFVILAPIGSRSQQTQQGDIFESGGRAGGGCDSNYTHYIINGTFNRCAWERANLPCNPLTKQFGMPDHVPKALLAQRKYNQYAHCGGDACDPKMATCWGWCGRPNKTPGDLYDSKGNPIVAQGDVFESGGNPVKPSCDVYDSGGRGQPPDAFESAGTPGKTPDRTPGRFPSNPPQDTSYTDGLLKGLDSCVKAINNAAAAVEAMKRNDFRTAAKLLGAQGQSVGLRAIYQIYQDVTGTNQIGISPYESGRIAGTRICNYFIIPEVSGRVGGAIGKVGKGAPPRASPSTPGPPLREPPPPAGPQQPPVRSAPQPTPTSAPPRLGAPPREPPQPAGPQQPPVRSAPQPPRSGAPPREQPQPAGPQQPPGRPQPQPVPKPNPGGPPTGTQPSPPRPQPNPGGPPTGTQPSPPRPQPNPAPNPRPGPITPPSGIQQFPPPQSPPAPRPKPDAQSPQQ